jgi:hypothetical protein
MLACSTNQHDGRERATGGKKKTKMSKRKISDILKDALAAVAAQEEEAPPAEKKHKSNDFAVWAELVVTELQHAVREDLKGCTEEEKKKKSVYFNIEGDYKIFDDDDEKSKEDAWNFIEGQSISSSSTMTGMSADGILSLRVPDGGEADELRRRQDEYDTWMKVWRNPRFWKIKHHDHYVATKGVDDDFIVLEERPAPDQLKSFHKLAKVSELRKFGPGHHFETTGVLVIGGATATPSS